MVNAIANLTVGGAAPLPDGGRYSLNMPVFAPTTDGTSINCLALTGTFSGRAGTATTMVVDLVGSRDLTGMAIPVGGSVGVPVLTYSPGGTAPTLLARYAAVGRYNVTPYPDGNAVKEKIVNATVQGFYGLGSSNWFADSNWFTPTGIPYSYGNVNGPDAQAWFQEVPGSPGGTVCVLDRNATTNSMLFYATPVGAGGMGGFSVVKSADPSKYILLSAVNSTTAAEAQIQVFGSTSVGASVNQIDPDIHIGAPLGGSSCPQVYLDQGSTLTLTGAISQVGVAPNGAPHPKWRRCGSRHRRRPEWRRHVDHAEWSQQLYRTRLGQQRDVVNRLHNVRQRSPQEWCDANLHGIGRRHRERRPHVNTGCHVPQRDWQRRADRPLGQFHIPSGRGHIVLPLWSSRGVGDGWLGHADSRL